MEKFECVGVGDGEELLWWELCEICGWRWWRSLCVGVDWEVVLLEKIVFVDVWGGEGVVDEGVLCELWYGGWYVMFKLGVVFWGVIVW